MIIHIGLPRAASTSIAQFHAAQGFKVINAGVWDIREQELDADYIKGESIADSVIQDDPKVWAKYLYKPLAWPKTRAIINPMACARIIKTRYPGAKILITTRNYHSWINSVYRYCARELPIYRRFYRAWLMTPSGISHSMIDQFTLTTIYQTLFQTCILPFEDLYGNQEEFMHVLCSFTGAKPGRLPKVNGSSSQFWNLLP